MGSKHRYAQRGAPLQFLQDAIASDTDDCIVWPFCTMGNGYGQIRIDGVYHRAHRFVCRAAHGEPSDVSLHAAHGCGNKLCVNPRHLRWATPSENQADRIEHGTDMRGENAPWAKLTTEAVREIIATPSRHRVCVDLAEKFGVRRGTISGLRKTARDKWKHV